MINHVFIDQARQGKNDWWRYLVTVVLGFGLQLVFSTILLGVFFVIQRTTAIENLSENALLVLSMAPFACLPLALWVGVRFLHHRPFLSLIGPKHKIQWRRLAVSGLVWFGLAGLSDFLVSIVRPGSLTWSFEPARFFPFLILALLLTPIQTATEELLFRGYLLQGFGLLSKTLWAPLLAPAVVFGLLHGMNPEIGLYGFWIMMAYYIGFGIFLGWITLKSNSLDLALGVHLANNLYSALIVTYPDSAIRSPALFTSPSFDPALSVLILAITALIYIVILLRDKKSTLAIGAILILGLTLSGCAPAETGQTNREPQVGTASVALSDCVLSASGVNVHFQAQCGTLAVPENRAESGGRTIDLNIAVIRAGSQNGEPDPVFLLAGGPGQASTEAFVPVLSAFRLTNFKRDLVLVDQRGTGKSNPLECVEDEVSEVQILGQDVPIEEQTAELDRCVKSLDADPRYYTTSEAAADLDAVRAALGYQRVNLVGVSYGTRLALAYLRTYPENVRTVLLNGVVPPGWAIGSTIEADSQSAMDQILARCAQDPGCQQAYPNLKAEFGQLLANLEAGPAEVSIADPLSGAATPVHLSRMVATSTLRYMTYSEDYSALIPLLIHEAANGRYESLAAQYSILLKSSPQAQSYGMFLSVVCSEDIPTIPGPEAGESFYDFDLEGFQTQCQHWPHATAPAALSEPVQSDAPVLMLTGGADPVTPRRNAEAAAKTLPNVRNVVIPGMGHNLMYQGCLPRVINEFIENGSAGDLDLSCLEAIHPLPFFTSFKGPQP